MNICSLLSCSDILTTVSILSIFLVFGIITESIIFARVLKKSHDDFKEIDSKYDYLKAFLCEKLEVQLARFTGETTTDNGIDDAAYIYLLKRRGELNTRQIISFVNAPGFIKEGMSHDLSKIAKTFLNRATTENLDVPSILELLASSRYNPEFTQRVMEERVVRQSKDELESVVDEDTHS